VRNTFKRTRAVFNAGAPNVWRLNPERISFAFDWDAFVAMQQFPRADHSRRHKKHPGLPSVEVDCAPLSLAN
jgi:hypothetical protein